MKENTEAGKGTRPDVKNKIIVLRLDGKNYPEWRQALQRHLRTISGPIGRMCHTIWHNPNYTYLDEDDIPGEPEIINPGSTQVEQDEYIAAVRERKLYVDEFYNGINAQARICELIANHIPLEMSAILHNVEDPHIMLQRIERKFRPTQDTRRLTAEAELENIRVNQFNNIDEYNHEILRIQTVLTGCGSRDLVTDERLMQKTIHGMPTVDAAQRYMDRMHTFKNFEDMIAALRMDEEIAKIFKQKKPGKPVTDIVRHTKEIPSTINDVKGYGKPKRKFPSQNMKHRNVKCFNCNHRGHYSSACKEPRKRQVRFKDEEKKVERKTVLRNSRNPDTTYWTWQKNDDQEQEKEDMETDKVNHITDTKQDTVNMTKTVNAQGLTETSHDYCVAMIDSATTRTILKQPTYFDKTTLTPYNGNFQVFVGQPMTINDGQIGTATVEIGIENANSKSRLVIPNAYLHKDVNDNIIALKDITAAGYSFKSTKHGIIFKHHLDSQDRFYAPKTPRGLYKLEIRPEGTLACYIESKEQELKNLPDIEELHKIFGHPGQTKLGEIFTNLYEGRMTKGSIRDLDCEICKIAKRFKHSFDSKKIANYPMEELSVDICGPFTPQTGKQERYILAVIDNFSRFAIVKVIKKREEALARVIQMMAKMLQVHPENRVKTLHIDKAGEFRSKAFDEFMEANGIQVLYAVPDYHEMNGVAENYFKRLQQVTRCLLEQAKLPTRFWGYAVKYASILLQCWPNRTIGKTPYEAFHETKPPVGLLEIFGEEVYAPKKKRERDHEKLGPQNERCIFIGIETNHLQITPSVIKVITCINGSERSARRMDCSFNRKHFPNVGRSKIVSADEWTKTDKTEGDYSQQLTEKEIGRVLRNRNIITGKNEVPKSEAITVEESSERIRGTAAKSILNHTRNSRIATSEPRIRDTLAKRDDDRVKANGRTGNGLTYARDEVQVPTHQDIPGTLQRKPKKEPVVEIVQKRSPRAFGRAGRDKRAAQDFGSRDEV